MVLVQLSTETPEGPTGAGPGRRGKRENSTLGQKQLCSLTACFSLAQPDVSNQAAAPDHQAIDSHQPIVLADPTPAVDACPKDPPFGTWGRGGGNRPAIPESPLVAEMGVFPPFAVSLSQERRGSFARPASPQQPDGVKFGRGSKETGKG
jgi:hypothetical protein